MTIDALTLRAIRDELRPLVGGRIEKVVLPDELAVGLEIYANRADHWLYISAHPQHARIHLVPHRLSAPDDRVSPLLLLLRKYARGARLMAIDQPPLERVLTLDFRKVDEGEVLETRLIVEVMGRYSNIILVDHDGVVLDAAKRVTAEMNRHRVTLPRQPYVPPPPQSKLDPEAITAADLRRYVAGSLEPLPRAIVTAVRGVSPLLGREIAFRATGRSDIAPAEVEDWEAVASTVRQLFASNDKWQPSIATKDSAITAFAPYLLTHLDGQPIDSMSAVIDAFYSQEQTSGTLELRKARLRQAIEDARARQNRKLDSLLEGLREAESAERLRQRGELLLAFGWQLSPGQAVLEVEGEQIEVDPALNPVENAQRYFREYAKAKHASAELPQLVEKTKLELNFFDQALTQVDLATTREDLEAIRAEIAEAGRSAPQLNGADGRQKKKQVGKSGRRKGVALRPAVSLDGYDVYVGRTSRQNDDLTFKLAAPHDLWFHARGVPGAHVVLRTQGQSVPESVVHAAAAIAAAQSQARDAAQVAVDYTSIRNVRRIKGAPPGLVTYIGEQTVHVKPSTYSGSQN